MAKAATKVSKKPAPKAKPVKKIKAVKATTKATKKTTVKKPTTEAKVAKLPPIKEPFNKTTLLQTLAETTGMVKKDVSRIFDSLMDIIHGHVQPKGPGEFTLPGVLKITVIQKPAVKERKGINPFTGEPTVFKAKPARKVVKVRPLKKLKDATDKK